MKKELIKGVSKEKSVVGLSKAKSRGQLVSTKESPKKTLSKTRSRAVLKYKNDPVSLITDDALDVRHNTKKKGEKEEEHQVNKVDAALSPPHQDLNHPHQNPNHLFAKFASGCENSRRRGAVISFCNGSGCRPLLHNEPAGRQHLQVFNLSQCRETENPKANWPEGAQQV